MKHAPGFLTLVHDAKKRVREISIEEVRAKLKRKEPFRFIDVREDHEWSEGRARKAEHIGRGILERDVEALVPDKRSFLVLYCGGGFRSALAGDNLQRMGYTKVRSMAGGFRAWKAAGAPVVKDRP